MAITLKTPADVDAMRVAGRLASEVLDFLAPQVKPGVTTLQIDKLAHDYMVGVQGTTPATLNYSPPGYPPYPASLCTSVNHEVCHGIPAERALKNGDIVNIDVTVITRTAGTATPAACSSSVKAASPPSGCARSTFEAMWKGIVIGQAGRASGRHRPRHPDFAEHNGFSVVREFCGHGIGQRSTRSRKCCTTAARAR